MCTQGTAFTITRGPTQIARGADQPIIYLELEG
jgi:hypothetical protein